MQTLRGNLNETFDVFADRYDEILNRGLALSGERKEFFAKARLGWLRRRLEELRYYPESVLDFGCGTGYTSALFATEYPKSAIVGIDISADTIKAAQTNYDADRVAFLPRCAFVAPASLDLAYCNGVFHHIKPDDRFAEVEFISTVLKPGGMLAFWENNPWNMATRLVMSRVEFDREAIMLTSTSAANLLKQVGFQILRCDYCFIFPRALRWLRPLESWVCGLPLGAQYMILCRKP